MLEGVIGSLEELPDNEKAQIARVLLKSERKKAISQELFHRLASVELRRL